VVRWDAGVNAARIEMGFSSVAGLGCCAGRGRRPVLRLAAEPAEGHPCAGNAECRDGCTLRTNGWLSTTSARPRSHGNKQLHGLPVGNRRQ